MTHPAEILPHDPIGPGAAVHVGERLFKLPDGYTAEQIQKFYAFVADGMDPAESFGRVFGK